MFTWRDGTPIEDGNGESKAGDDDYEPDSDDETDVSYHSNDDADDDNGDVDDDDNQDLDSIDIPFAGVGGALLFWKDLSENLESWGFTLNPYDKGERY